VSAAASFTTTALVERARARGHAIAPVQLRSWLRTLAEGGLAVGLDGDRWTLTTDGWRWFGLLLAVLEDFDDSTGRGADLGERALPIPDRVTDAPGSQSAPRSGAQSMRVDESPGDLVPGSVEAAGSPDSAGGRPPGAES